MLLALGVLADRAFACSLVPGYEWAVAREIAATGYLVEGRITQAFDPVARTPEIIEVTRIFIGEGMPRRFVIARDDEYFNLRDTGINSSCPPTEYRKVSQRTEFFVLFPARPDAGCLERWRFGDAGVLYNPYYASLLAAAGRQGRLRGAPPGHKPDIW